MTQAKQPTTDQTVAYSSVIPHTPLRFLWYVTKPYKWWAISAVALSIVLSTATSSLSLFFKFIVDAVEAGNIEQAFLFGLMYPVAVFIIQSTWRFDGFLGMNWTLNAEEKGYNDLVNYTLKHSHGYFINRFAGSVLSKVSNVTNAMESIIIESLWTHISGFTAFVVTFILISTVSVPSGLIFLALLLTLFLVNWNLSPEKMRRSFAAADETTRLRGNIVDLFTNAGAVRQFAHGRYEADNLREGVRTFKQKHRRSWLYTELMLLVNVTILSVFNFGMFYVLIERWSAGLIGTGDFLLVLGLVTQITGTMIFIGRAFNQTARAFGEAKEGLQDLLLQHEVQDAAGAKQLQAPDGAISWEEVHFEFGKTQVFTDFTLHIPAGQRVGLVGHSGAGKTTFVSLLLRQHDLTAGSISIDGQDISAVTQDSLRKHIAVVPQEPMLFHRTIRENIAYGKPSATQAEIEEVAKKAQAHEFISRLEDGYETLVGERGVKLSGGQKQRIAIARAMLKDAPILVLDEATSALDSESEVEIQRALHQLMVGKTVIAVAHRLSTLREMDRIIVLEEGKVIEDGSHDALVNYGGVYAGLWQHQAGGFLQD